MTVLVRVEQAAKQLGISRTVAFRLVHDGELHSVKIGRARRVPQEAIDAYVAKLLAAQQLLAGDVGRVGGAA
ncbi:MAG: helix-turn-helix domain-containing protein [Acidothermaceae bacterium]